MIAFWERLGVKSPTLADFAKSQNIEDIDAYRDGANKLEKELATKMAI